MNNPGFRIASILYALIIGFFGVNHFMNAHRMAGVVPSYFPGSIVWVYISGAAMILAALAFIVNFRSKLAGYLLALLFLIIIGTIHLPHYLHAPNETAKWDILVTMLKDAAIATAALMIASKGK